jgi:hypothetical protein
VRTSFLHVADTRLGFRDPRDPEVFEKVARQFRFAIDFAIDHRAAFVLFSGQVFTGPEVEPDALQVALRGLNQLAAKNITAIAVRGRCELPSVQPRDRLSWHDLLAQEGLLVTLEPGIGDRQLQLSRWERREGRGSFVDLGRCRVFGLPYTGSMAEAMLPALAKAVGALDNREADFKVVLVPGVLENCSAIFGPRLAHSDVHLLRRHVDYVALGGCDDAYESEGWLYNPGCAGLYHVTVDTAVQPNHVARFVAYPSALSVSRPALPMQRASRQEQEERILDELAAAEPAETVAGPSVLPRDVVRLVTQMMWSGAESAELRVRLLEAAGRQGEPDRAA